MRTTVDIPDAMYRRLKARAAAEGRTVKALMLKGVETVLAAKAGPRRRRLSLPIVSSKRPGTMRLDNARIDVEGVVPVFHRLAVTTAGTSGNLWKTGRTPSRLY